MGDRNLAIEIKGSSRVHEGDARALHALLEDGPVGKACIVSLEIQPRTIMKNIEVLPWRIFLEKLWQNDLGLE